MEPTDLHVGAPLQPRASERTSKVRCLVMMPEGVGREGKRHPRPHQANAEFVVFAAAQAAVEPTDPPEQLGAERKISAQQVAISEAMAGLPHRVELRLPPL